MAQQPGNEQITLYYKEGSSDKIYHASIEPRGGGYVVNFAFGRRGTTLNTGTKTDSPVDFAAAKKIYDKLVKEKTAKGYTPGETGTPYQQTDKADRATGIVPQLLNSIDEDQIDLLISDDNWWTQEKYDGRRLLIRKQTDAVIGINRSGLIVDLPKPIADAVAALSAATSLLDGETVGDVFVAFDLLEVSGEELANQAYHLRHGRLVDLVDVAPTNALRIAETAAGKAGKQKMLPRLRAMNKEGIVFKRKDAAYKPGRPASGGNQLKHKFYATASCIVAGISTSKRSVQLELIDDTGARVAVGNVTVPVNQSIPVKGDIVEVRYLYAYPGGSLYQPYLIGKRDDIVIDACTIGQLKYKPADTDDN